MTLSKSSLYALYAAFELAVAEGQPVPVADLAERHGIPPTTLAKVLQQLVRAGIAVGARGVGGGYRLARPASTVSVLDVISVFERPGAPREPLPVRAASGPAPIPAGERLQALFEEVDDLVRSTYASVSLETLARAGVR